MGDANVSPTVGLPEIDRQEHAVDDNRTAHLQVDGHVLCGSQGNVHGRSCSAPFLKYTSQRFCPYCGWPVCAYCRLLADGLQTVTPTRRRWWKRGSA